MVSSSTALGVRDLVTESKKVLLISNAGLALALACRPRVLLMDEPAAGMSAAERDEPLFLPPPGGDADVSAR